MPNLSRLPILRNFRRVDNSATASDGRERSTDRARARTDSFVRVPARVPTRNRLPAIPGGHVRPDARAIADLLENAELGRGGRRILEVRLSQIRKNIGTDKPIDLAKCLVVKKGEKVPVEFRGLTRCPTDSQGVAMESYQDTWCESHWDNNGGWDNGWGECWDNSTGDGVDLPSGFYAGTPDAMKSVELNEFSAMERATLARFGIN